MEISLAGLDNLKPPEPEKPDEKAVLAMMEGVKKKGEIGSFVWFLTATAVT